MEQHRAIPPGYMKIGQLAKMARISVRTLQYYDNEGLLSPSAESEGGFRLYSDKDVAKLTQILLMKQLGFTLKEIKSRLPSFDSPAEVIDALSAHATSIRGKIEALSKSLNEIEALKEEVAQINSVDFLKFTAILMNLQLKNRFYRAVKHFDDDLIMSMGERMTIEEAETLQGKINSCFEQLAKLKSKGVPPDNEKAQNICMEILRISLDITGGDMELMKKINEAVQKDASEEFVSLQNYMQKSMEAYAINQYETNGEDVALFEKLAEKMSD